MNGQGMIPGQQQAPQQAPQGQNQTYPANAEEAGQFVNDIMRMLYTEGQPEKIMQNLTTGGNLPQKLGQTAGTVVMSVLSRRREETGRKPHLKLVVMGLKKTLEELGEMMEMAGLPKPTPEIMQEASQYAGQIVESAISPQQQQQQQGQPMQGQPQQQAPQGPQGGM